MKKLLCSFAALILFAVLALPIYAQPMIGARIGVNLANESWDSQDPNIGIKIGFLGGAQCDYWIDDRFGVGAQLIFDMKGARFTPSDGLPNETDDENLNTLEIPILLKLRMPAGTIKPYAFIGPSIGILLSSTLHSEYTVNGQSHDTSFTLSNRSSTDFSVLFGAGIMIDAGSVDVNFDAGYAIGLTNVAIIGPVKSRDIRIAAGILFPL